MKKIVIVFLCLSAAAWAQYETQQNYKESADKIESVFIECDMGKIYCEPVDDDSVSISVKKNVFIANEEKAKKLADDCRVDFDLRNKTLKLVVDIPRRGRHNDITIGSLLDGNFGNDLEIWVKVGIPQGIRTEIETASADIFLSDLKGNDLEVDGASSDIMIENTKCNCRFELSSGDLEARNIDGDLDITGSSSEINIDGLTGNLEISVSSGDCFIEKVAGDATIRSTSGDIDIINLTGDLNSSSNSGDFQGENIAGSVDISTSSGAINLMHFAGNEKNILTDSNSGDIQIEIPFGFKGRIELESISGDINSRVDLSTKSRSSTYLSGSLGEGNGNIKVETTSGDIFLESY